MGEVCNAYWLYARCVFPGWFVWLHSPARLVNADPILKPKEEGGGLCRKSQEAGI